MERASDPSSNGCHRRLFSGVLTLSSDSFAHTVMESAPASMRGLDIIALADALAHRKCQGKGEAGEALSPHTMLILCAAYSVKVAGVTGLEPAASGVTGQRSNQLSYTPIQGP